MAYGRLMREFTTKEKPPAKPIDFSVDGREMVFHNPGWAPIILMKSTQPNDVTRTYLDWLGAGLPDEDAEWILARLLDPKDDFDLIDITNLCLGVLEEVTGRPIVPPTDSSDSLEVQSSTDGRHLAESTSKDLMLVDSST